jgi:hypothetical protein
MKVGELPEIPVFEVGQDFPVETVRLAGRERGYAMLDAATAGVPSIALRAADALSRHWLKARNSAYLPEIDEIAALSNRPGAYFFNVDYEWGCTTAAKPAADAKTARLLRVLDWKVNGLGRYVVAACIRSALGPWVSLTWPGFTGVLQAMAPGRFAAAINQPSVKKKTGVITIDWLLSKRDIWRSPYGQPVHLLRRVFEEAASFADARHMLESTPICAPVIYTLAGLSPSEVCVIERRETSGHVLRGSACAANEWQAADWRSGHFSAFQNAKRLGAMQAMPGALDLSRLQWPVLNSETRLAFAADPARGHMIAQGYESDGPATRPLEMIFANGQSKGKA